MKNNILLTSIIAVVVGAGGFYAGMKYQESKRVQFFGGAGGGQLFRNGNMIRNGTSERGGFRPVSGEIISADKGSVTVKLEDGSSKIILVSSSTNINKAETAEVGELTEGTKVAVFGTENKDGSISAQNIQLNPIVRMQGEPR